MFFLYRQMENFKWFGPYLILKCVFQTIFTIFSDAEWIVNGKKKKRSHAMQILLLGLTADRYTLLKYAFYPSAGKKPIHRGTSSV